MLKRQAAAQCASSILEYGCPDDPKAYSLNANFLLVLHSWTSISKGFTNQQSQF